MKKGIKELIDDVFSKINFSENKKNIQFKNRFYQQSALIASLYQTIYGNHPDGAAQLTAMLEIIATAHKNRKFKLLQRDEKKLTEGNWFLSRNIVGMSLYVDRFTTGLNAMPDKLPYLKELGVNFLHIMPIMQSPPDKSDGGYAVSDFRKVDERFGTNEDLKNLQQALMEHDMYLMLDIVLNHTSCMHDWAIKAKKGDSFYQNFFYTYDTDDIPNQMNQTMPEIFPESSPGSFTYDEEMKKWVMTVFHHYQWDLNYTNPHVFTAMLDTIFYYANLGVDILRIDAPAFIWKQQGTTCQNLPMAHTILQLIKACVAVAAPGMALLGEAIVAPKEIMKYFGTGNMLGKECDIAYGATNMALQWDTLATGNIKLYLESQHDILQKPYGATWISYTRCHDDIGLGYEDEKIAAAGFNPYQHRKFIKDYYSGNLEFSMATGALFSVNPKTNDARISGSLASLCGLEKAMSINDEHAINTAINKIILMQAHSMFIGGIPMLFYGDEVGTTNDYSYLNDDAKSYDNRWMHRPIIDWNKVNRYTQTGTIEHKIFTATQKMIAIRRAIPMFDDHSNIEYMSPHNSQILGFIRALAEKKVVCLFNYNSQPQQLTWYAFKEKGITSGVLYNHVNDAKYTIGANHEHFSLQPYQYAVLEIC